MRRTLKQPKKRLDHSPRHDDRTATLITVEIFPECRSPGKAGPSGNSFAIPATRHKLFLSGNNTLRKFVAGLNIDHYREILAVETDPTSGGPICGKSHPLSDRHQGAFKASSALKASG
jgi:hypothetical protein